MDRVTYPRRYERGQTFAEKRGFFSYLGLIILGAAFFPVGFRIYYRDYFLDYTGQMAAQVIEVLGDECRDSRQRPEYRAGEPFQLIWSYYIGGFFVVEFEQGVAVSQSRFSM